MENKSICEKCGQQIEQEPTYKKIFGTEISYVYFGGIGARDSYCMHIQLKNGVCIRLYTHPSKTEIYA